MIHQLLTLTRPLIVFDTETTGVNPQEDRIVELGFQLWTAEGLQKEWRSLVDPGVPIPEVATKVHGITNEKLKLCRECEHDESKHPPPNSGVHPQMCAEGMCGCAKFVRVFRFADIAANIAKGFSDCDFAGKNVRFDLRILAAEMKRARVAWNYVGARILDADRLEQIAIPRSLSHLHEKYVTAPCDKCSGLGYTIFDAEVGLERCPPCKGTGQIGKKLDGAHGAMADVAASTLVIAKQLEAHAALPRDLDALHKLQWPGWLDAEGKFRIVNGVATCFFGKWNGKPMRAIEPGYWDWLLRSDFPEDVQQLARDAKLGKYPEVKP